MKLILAFGFVFVFAAVGLVSCQEVCKDGVSRMCTKEAYAKFGPTPK